MKNMNGMSIGQELIVMASGSKGKSMNEYYQYLDALRESGVTNMYGAGAYLRDRFDLSKEEARDILTAWMKQFTK
jgi:hypothetical protein